jgi:hypothetical protein
MRLSRTGPERLLWLSLALVAICLGGLPANAWGKTYICTEVKDKARLAYGGNLSVNVKGENKICDFSIDGETPSGRSPEFLQSTEDFRSGKLQGNRSTGERVDFLRRLLLSPFVDLRQDYRTAQAFDSEMTAVIDQIVLCMEQFRGASLDFLGRYQGQPPDWKRFSPNIVQVGSDRNSRSACTLLLPGVGVPAFAGMEVTSDIPLLQVGALLPGQFFVVFMSPWRMLPR